MGAIALGVGNLVFQADRTDELPAWVRERLALLQRQTRHFVWRSTLLLDVTQMATGRPNVERSTVDLAGVARWAVGELSHEAARAGCEIRPSLSPDVVGSWNESALQQVALSFLGNAIKYGAGQPVDVFVRGDAGRAAFGVRDRGPGIAHADRVRVFDPFERAVSARDGSGMGLSLWIARQLVRAHGGDIVVEGEPGVGSAFTASLPF
jgi:signal transduction histidine kinase